jgi:hypothetical protein
MPDTVTLVGLMVGFLVMGVIGMYVGDQVMASSDQFNGTGIQPSVAGLKETWGLMVNAMKVMIVVTIAAITFLLLQQGGLIGSGTSYRAGGSYRGSYGRNYGGGQQQVTRETQRQAPGRVEPPAQPAAQHQEEKSAEPEKEKDKRDRYEAIKV